MYIYLDTHFSPFDGIVDFTVYPAHKFLPFYVGFQSLSTYLHSVAVLVIAGQRISNELVKSFDYRELG